MTSELVTAEILETGIYRFDHWKFRSMRLGPLRYMSRCNWKGALTCNLGVMRNQFEAVGGFDETFRQWEGEDCDFVRRLMTRGVFIKSGRLKASVLHLWH